MTYRDTPFTLVAVALGVICSIRGVTAAQPAMSPTQSVPPGGFFFVQLSDTQFGFSNGDKDFIQDTASAELAVATINRLKPAFVVVTGDLVNKAGDAAQIAEYQRIIAKIDRSVPVYSVSGNHDLENSPTTETLAAYRKTFGKDYYSFRSASLYGIVINSTLISDQDLSRARASGAKHLVVFQHHPAFLEKIDEADQYFNLPRERRDPFLKLLRDSGVEMVVSGHLHRAAEATDSGLQSVVTGAVGRPLGGSSGLRVFVVTDTAITHRFYPLGELPYSIPRQ
jgi:3',5'-cyclic AMP phosphodiesterase CpdA